MTEVAEKPAEVVADTTGDASKEDEAAKPAVKLGEHLYITEYVACTCAEPRQPVNASCVAEGEALRDALAKQIDYYFSRTNLSNDAYLVSQMDAQMFVPIATICNFKLMKMLTEGSLMAFDCRAAALMLSLCVMHRPKCYSRCHEAVQECRSE